MKYKFVFLMAIFGLVFLIGIQNSSAITCYQESANVSNQTTTYFGDNIGHDGGSSCGLNYSGSYIVNYDINQGAAYDGNWSNFTTIFFTGIGTMFSNYTLPSNSVVSAVNQLRYNRNTVTGTETMNVFCYNYSSSSFSTIYTDNSSSSEVTTNITIPSGCLSGSELDLYSSLFGFLGQGDFYDEAMWWNVVPAGTSSTETIESTNITGNYSSIALDSNGMAHISYVDSTSGNLKYCNGTAGSWTCETLDTSNNTALTSIAIDSLNNFHIAYIDRQYIGTNVSLKYCTGTYGSFNCEILYTITDNGQGIPENLNFPSIAVNSSNAAHISFFDFQPTTFTPSLSLRYCQGTSGNFNCEQITTIGRDSSSQGTIAINSTDKVYILYEDTLISPSTVSLCSGTFGAFSCEDVNYSNSFIAAPSIAIDSTDKVHTAFTDYTNLYYCSGTPGNFNCGIVESTPNGGGYSSIALDSNDDSYISYLKDGASSYELRLCHNESSSWNCTTLETLPALELIGSPTSRNLAMKEGRLVDSTSFSDFVHISWQNNSDLMYTVFSPNAVAGSSCSCPASGNFVVSDGSACTLTTTCNIGANAFRLFSGSFRISSTGALYSQGCFIEDSQPFFVEDGGKLMCS